ncbi:MAG: hypothetical protein ACM3S5_01525 [Rhodospirillales bacterium]
MIRLAPGLRTALALVLSAALIPAAPPQQNPAVTHAALAAVETRLDNTIRSLDVSEPYDLLGMSRGLYLPGFGAVFTAELNLVFMTISPFVPALTPADIERLHAKKLARVVTLKRHMRDMMVNAAVALKAVPPEEQIVLGISLFYRKFEIKDGLPNQVIMQAPRKALLDFEAGRIDAAALDALIRTQEL